MFNIRKNKEGFTLVELIVVIAILAILAGTAAGIGVTLINKNTNKTAQSEVNMLVDDFKTFVTIQVSADEDGRELGDTVWTSADVVIAAFKEDLENGDSKQLGKIDTKIATMPTAKDSNTHKKAGERKFNYVITEETSDSFTVTFFCDVKGAAKFGDLPGDNDITADGKLIVATYKYSKTIG